MMSSRFTLFLITSFALGCGSTTPPPKTASTPEVLAPPHATQAPASQPAPGALAQATASFATAIEKSLARRAAATQPALNPKSAPAVSIAPSNPPPLLDMPEIKWLDPKFELAASPAAPATQPAPIPQPPDPTSRPIAVQLPLPSTDQLTESITDRIKSRPRDLGAQLDLQLLQMLRGQSVPNLQALAQLPLEDREILSAILDSLVNFRAEFQSQDNLLLSRKTRSLIELADRLRAQSNLRIPTIALCTRVSGFGVYEPLDPDRFAAGRNHEVIVYCEVENFTSQQLQNKDWKTHLVQESVLYNDRGQRVHSDKPHPINDVARAKRRDFSTATRLRLPATLPPGRYALTITITDPHTNRMADATLPLQVVSAASVVP